MREIHLPPSREENTAVDIALVALPSLLDPVRIVSAQRCPRRADASRAFALLDQARAGLLAAVVTREQNPGFVKVLKYQRLLHDDVILVQRVTVDSGPGSSGSFGSVRSAAELVKNGFVDAGPSTERYFGPDADVLLDDEFAAGYCFRIADRDRWRPTEIGLAFAAVNNKRGRVDIAGTLWVDTVTWTLADIRYHYTGVASIEAPPAEGMTSFRQMNNGVVIVDRWYIRLPKQQAETTSMPRRAIRTWYETSESGGEVAWARWPDGTTWKGSLGALRVSMVNRDGTPAAGATVQLLDTDYLGIADSAGVATVDDLLPGPYKVAVVDSQLAQAHIPAPPSFEFPALRDSVVNRRLDVNAARDYTYKRCVAKQSASPNNVLLLGKVERPDGHAMPGAVIDFSSLDYKLFASFKTGTDGVFYLCVPTLIRPPAVLLRIRAPDGSRKNVAVTVVGPLTTLLVKFDSRY